MLLKSSPQISNPIDTCDTVTGASISPERAFTPCSVGGFNIARGILRSRGHRHSAFYSPVQQVTRMSLVYAVRPVTCMIMLSLETDGRGVTVTHICNIQYVLTEGSDKA